MSTYVMCISRLTVKRLHLAIKRQSSVGADNFILKYSQSSQSCLHCQRYFTSFSVPVNAEEQKKDKDKIEELELNTSVRQSAEVKEESSKGKKLTQKTNKGIKGLDFFDKKNNHRNPSSYFENKFLAYISSLADEDLNLDGNESKNIDKFSKRSERISIDIHSGDNFGSLAEKVVGKAESDMRNPNERIDEILPEDLDEPRDRRLDIPLTREGRIGKTSFYYNRKIARYGREGKIKDAIAVFEEIMMLRDRVKPSKRTFITLIGILGRVGYTKKAFELLTKMKHLGLDPEDHIYTSLFNACANSPFPSEALRKAQDLLWSLQDHGIRPNLFTIKAAMKAFSLCGDFPMAFRLMDKASAWLKLDVECFNHLLMASISDKSNGFHRALQVWQKMFEYRVVPNTATYNLLLRCVRDCSIGDPEEFFKYLGLDSQRSVLGENVNLIGDNIDKNSFKIKGRNQLVVIGKSVKNKTDSSPAKELNLQLTLANRIDQPVQFISDAKINASEVKPVTVQSEENVNALEKSEKKYPSISEMDRTEADILKNIDFSKSIYLDILSDKNSISALMERSSKVSVKDLKYPEGRLAALGGSGCILKHMARAGAQPSIQTYTLMLASMPSNELSEFELLTQMESSNFVPDIDFLNDIMMRRNKRQERESVKSLLPILSKLRLTPNMRTYAALALACHSEKDAQDLLDDMKGANIEPTVVVMGHLILSSRMNYNYKLSMLIKLERLGLKPDKEIIAAIEDAIAKTKKLIIEAEKNKDENNYFLSEQFQKSFQKFLRFYKHWLQRTELQKENHPWKAYQLTKDSGQLKPSPEDHLYKLTRNVIQFYFICINLNKYFFLIHTSKCS
ncbi:hypothetical protein Btru_071413 [Bulinus truncatus]|nr:hypothetical protein Btru_071413 [Bulinus truncatus]